MRLFTRKEVNKIKSDSFQSGKRAGLWIADNFVYTMPIDSLQKDSGGWVARLAHISNYRNQSVDEINTKLKMNGKTMYNLKPSRDKKSVKLTLL